MTCVCCKRPKAKLYRVKDPEWTYFFNDELTDGSVEAYCSLACVKDFNDIPKGNKKIIIELVE